jgi:hypothetical protein
MQENIALKCIYSALITSASAMAVMVFLFIPIYVVSHSEEFTGKVIDTVFVAGIVSGALFPEIRHWCHHLHILFSVLP